LNRNPVALAREHLKLPRTRCPAVPVAAIGTKGVLVVGALAWLALALYWMYWGRHWDVDLQVYRAAGHALYSGSNPYSHVYTKYGLAFTYPPFALLALSPLSLGPLGFVSTIWLVLSCLALVAVICLGIRSVAAASAQRSILIAFACAPVAMLVLEPLRSNLDYGQINALLMMAVAMDLLSPGRRGKGILIGLAGAVKLTPLIFLMVFVVRRDWRSACRGVLTFLATSAATGAVLPSESRLYWTHLVFDPGRVGSIAYWANQSWFGMLHRPPIATGAHVTLLWPVVIALTCAAGTWLAWRLSDDARDLDALLVVAFVGLLVSPISWSHHWSWLALAPVVVVARWRTRRAEALGLIVLMSVAVAAPYGWNLRGWLGDVTSDSLALAAIVTLIVFLVSEAHIAVSGAALARRPRLASRGLPGSILRRIQ
jgi:alpha-1,2-mannosyltransferase